MPLDAAIRDIVREIFREEIVPIIREEIRAAVRVLIQGAAPVSKQYLTTKEAAELLGVKVETIGDWIRSGALQAARLPNGGDYRIPADAIAKMLAPPGAQQAAPEPKAEAVRMLSVLRDRVGN